MISSILEGMHFAKAAFIITDYCDEIAKEIMDKIPRGATGLKAKGIYTRKDKDMLFVVVSQMEIMKLREIVKAVDENAFITIADVRDVLGEGFIEENNNSLST